MKKFAWRSLILAVSVGVAVVLLQAPASTMDNETCLMCHSDPELEAEDGRNVGVDGEAYRNSVHAGFACTDCHVQDADYDDIPHYTVYRKVDCSYCHEDAVASFQGSFHEEALRQGTPNAPKCYSCHGTGGDPHAIHGLGKRTAEEACRQCHQQEADLYDGSLHARAAAAGKDSPGCTGCHPTHAPSLPPSAGAVNSLCESCHEGAMEELAHSGHRGESLEGKISCSSCHDVHATHKPHVDETTLSACNECHPGYCDSLRTSVHKPLVESNQMNCLSCHRSHQMSEEARETEDFGCGACHEEAEQEYRTSVHRRARLRGDEVAATCGDCHSGHKVLPASDPESMVNHFNIPDLCGKCHTEETVITSDYVRLPISLPSYLESIHGKGWVEGKPTAVCTDCHGDHDLESAASPTSSINKNNLAITCGQCHRTISEDYLGSVHGRALAHGITDSPSCTDCHDEHLIRATKDERSAVHKGNQATMSCGSCHEDPEMAVRYGLPPEVVQSYVDSYHGWAIKRGGKAVAVCEDCHNTHDIRSRLDPKSSIHPDNVVATCGRCHANSNPRFAASYSHVLARDKKMIHDWVALVYWILIPLVLGGMLIHNLVIYVHDLKIHYQKTKREPAVKRMTTSEVWQHIILAVCFIMLGITGFALRFPESWWVDLLAAGGMTEELRRILHRVFAMILVATSFYHLFYLLFTGRGRLVGKAMFPKPKDALEALQNMMYYMGLRKKAPVFGMYDYTQKAEYWALIWGQIVMTITGFILMFPEVTTAFTPAWVVRVSETFHFYEAILAVSAIAIWHFFFVIFIPREYPMSWIWITGRMPKHQWEHHHGREPEETGKQPELLPGEDTHLDEEDKEHLPS